MKRLLLLAIMLSALGCTETPVSLPLRSLERSGEVSFVCTDKSGQGYDINSCPDFDSEENARHLVALVTQTLRGEVAVVDLSAGAVVDLDSSTPGYNFIPTGANPVDIVSTPGGVASFVGVAETGMEGIFGIPSTCTRPPAHDLVAFPACSLPVAPGEMAIVIDPPAADDDGDPSTPAPVRESCESAPSAAAATPGTALAATREECPADLALEVTPPGRRKLLVTLPDLGGYGIIDAQELLDREPGSFQPCAMRFVELDVSVPVEPIEQKVPADLVKDPTDQTCVGAVVNYAQPQGFTASQPDGIELADGTLYVADRSVPVVHRVDLGDPCEPKEQPPLLPLAFESPGRVVYTSQVAVSPPTSKGQRFAYAIDDYDGSVMIFEVTPGHADRTPIVRPGSPRLPFEPPDRILFNSPAKDVTFALRDVPVVDPETGVATIGTYCDPDPGIDPTSPAAKYRPSLDYRKGAAPRNLRGSFGFVMLASGQVSVVDLEDFDAPCRRPVTANPNAFEDFRGCVNDPATPLLYQTADERRTVTDELSCRIVEQHRARSGRMQVNASELGVNAAALRSFPRLRAPEGGNLPTDSGEEGIKYPKVLAVDFPDPAAPATSSVPAKVHIGTTLYSSDSTTGNVLPVDPLTATRPSVALVQREPRAFGGDEDMTLEYEGAFVAERKTGFPTLAVPGQADELADGDAAFCDRGVRDAELVEEVGTTLGVPAADLPAFVRRHGDYVQITQEVPGKDAPYWSEIESCGEATGKAAYFSCRERFGTVDAPTDRRDFRIVEAYQYKLVIEPRAYESDQERDEIVELAACCFGRGSAVAYKVRAGHQWVLTGSTTGFAHDVTADTKTDPATNLPPTLRCKRDCNPRRRQLESRAFEISAKDCTPPEDGEPTDCAIGKATPDDVACVLTKSGPAGPGSEASACVFENLTHRFAVYRGMEPSKRDMAFVWSISGGFQPLFANLATQTRSVSPQSISFVPQIGQLAVADGASEGLVLISLDSVSVSRLFF